MKTIEDFKYYNLIKNSHLSMSSFQIKKFIIDDQLTDYKKAKQCLLELRTRYNQFEDTKENLELKKIKMEKIKIDIEELKYKLAQEKDEFNKKRLELTIKEKEIKLRGLERSYNTLKEQLQYLLNEIEEFEKYLDKIGITEELIKSLEYGPENYEKEREFWKEKFTRSAVFELLGQGRISANLLETISNLDKEDQLEILSKTFEHVETLKKSLAYIQENALENSALKEKELLKNNNE